MEYFMDAIKNKYAQFDGRARRSEYWYFTLFSVIGFFVIGALATVLGMVNETLGMIAMGIAGIYWLAILVPSIAVAVRRWHDLGKPWFWIFIGLIPMVGGIVSLYFMVQDSQPGDNEFGPNPKGLLN